MAPKSSATSADHCRLFIVSSLNGCSRSKLLSLSLLTQGVCRFNLFGFLIDMLVFLCMCVVCVALLVPLANWMVWRFVRHCIELVMKGIASFGYYIAKTAFRLFVTLFSVCVQLSVLRGCLLPKFILVVSDDSFVTVFGNAVNFLVAFTPVHCSQSWNIYHKSSPLITNCWTEPVKVVYSH